MRVLVSKRKFEKLLRNVRHRAHLYYIISNKSMTGSRVETVGTQWAVAMIMCTDITVLAMYNGLKK